MAFVALLQKMHELKKVAICRLIPRANSNPRFVALIPQPEAFDDNHVQIAPPGFHVVYLPFSDDIRKMAFEEMPKASDVQTEVVKKIVSRLELKNFSPKDYENPALQTHYANLQALALNKDHPDEIVDYTKPAEERMKKRAEDLAAEWRTLVFPPGYDPRSEIPQTKTKTKAADDGEGPSQKKVKTGAYTKEEVKELVNDGGVSDFLPQRKTNKKTKKS